MKLSKRIKLIAGATVLAVGIPTGIAFASPAQHLNIDKPAVTQHMSQGATPTAGAAQQPQMAPGTHNPANSPMMQTTDPAPADNSKTAVSMPMVNMSASPAHNPDQMVPMNPEQMMKANQMNTNHMKAPAADEGKIVQVPTVRVTDIDIAIAAKTTIRTPAIITMLTAASIADMEWEVVNKAEHVLRAPNLTYINKVPATHERTI